ncbi:protein-L-isoaspartate(D-aspartate) O-methyltransferase [Roseivirga pacifica]|uniref:protein-L-isoaspartate(D-aspartate) O-methyltransferase n=1 Tax=Roseivirga pacifica TaxID=1267423 RepID=UPI00336E019F|nr:protein-L-isoaspartate(D-aspartate) O-methyltransferase [Roseivirga pacifica]MCO6368871.1 protein-L-isoaspartate(D-aspartate) O-methyltransferase [Roseivirga pacifica]MCO6373014.1 protein-L-isoaspartate(D-aspartate) O-methyltransferase [Roseivirga pacifica]MCO6373094.1 protein-L-isoaspartate(D-aspartate) O-methyltransferase [Roseivirga pacifica]MCO6377649.1 protein-L-isoaspartate(D-aspartate) O-methyltransferase [Roseivirga pacifica]
MVDSYRHKGMRRQLVKLVESKGIKDQRVLAAIGRIPRHFFFENAFLEHAYEDKAFPIGAGQTISQPYTVAFQSELLNIKPGDKVLEIGTGSGYQAIVLMELGADVFTIEYQKELYLRTKSFLPKMGYSPNFFYGDGSKGLERFAPYDKIIVTAGAPTVPDSLIDQLKVGGSLVIPVGNAKTQQMLRINKVTEKKISSESFHDFKFVPLLGDKGWK